jgi:hypothetical protein
MFGIDDQTSDQMSVTNIHLCTLLVVIGLRLMSMISLEAVVDVGRTQRMKQVFSAMQLIAASTCHTRVAVSMQS